MQMDGFDSATVHSRIACACLQMLVSRLTMPSMAKPAIVLNLSYLSGDFHLSGSSFQLVRDFEIRETIFANDAVGPYPIKNILLIIFGHHGWIAFCEC